MEILREIGEIILSNNYDKNDVLQTLKDKGYEIRVIPSDNCFRYGILIKEQIYGRSGE